MISVHRAKFNKVFWRIFKLTSQTPWKEKDCSSHCLRKIFGDYYFKIRPFPTHEEFKEYNWD